MYSPSRSPLPPPSPPDSSWFSQCTRPEQLSFKPAFSLSSFTFIKRIINTSSLPATKIVSSAYLRLLILLPAILIPAVFHSALLPFWGEGRGALVLLIPRCCCYLTTKSSVSLRHHGLQLASLAFTFTISKSLLKLTSLESVMPSNHLILCCPILLLTSIFPSIMVFSSGSALYIRGPEYWSFNFSICPTNEYSGLISFEINCFDFLADHGTLKSLLQHHNSKSAILWHSAFFMVQISYFLMNTGKKTKTKT